MIQVCVLCDRSKVSNKIISLDLFDYNAYMSHKDIFPEMKSSYNSFFNIFGEDSNDVRVKLNEFLNNEVDIDGTLGITREYIFSKIEDILVEYDY